MALTLPTHDSLKAHEGKGNFAIEKYFVWPYKHFYRKKLQMVADLLDQKTYYNILDLGCGPGILTEELKKHSIRLKSVDRTEDVKWYWNFELVVCASLLEFVDLESTVFSLSRILKPHTGQLIVASPMSTILTRFYFKLIGDKQKRHSHEEIVREISKRFRITEYHTWENLYFSLKAVRL